MGRVCTECGERPAAEDRTRCNGCRSRTRRGKPCPRCKVNPRGDKAVCAKCRAEDRAAARRGVSPKHDMTHEVPEGFHVGGVTTQYNGAGGITQQWVKSRIDAEQRLIKLADAVREIGHEIPRAKPVERPGDLDDDLLAVYPMGDPHIGLYTWAAETGQSFDLEIAERNLIAAVDHLVDLAPPAKQALVINLGDFFHADNAQSITMRGNNPLDVDTRWAKVLSVGVRVMRRVIDRALERHELVRVICEIGNHDDHSALMLALCLDQYYEREARVEVDTSPAKFHWVRFGKCLIGTTHGDTVKPARLPAIMACDRAKDWGETEFRYWYVGHVHHDSRQEHPGCIVETFRTLAPRDAWHSAQGYRSGQDMKLDILHRTRGRMNRHIIGIRQVWDLAHTEKRRTK